MRMWMVVPSVLCRKHLLGEHLECHMILSLLRSNKSILGYIKSNCIEPRSVKERHDNLAVEMELRGYNHNSELILNCGELERFINVIIDKRLSENLLFSRCEECRQNKVERDKKWNQE